MEHFFSISVYFPKHSRFTGQQGKGEGIYLTLLYQFHPLDKHLNISQHLDIATTHRYEQDLNQEPVVS